MEMQPFGAVMLELRAVLAVVVDQQRRKAVAEGPMKNTAISLEQEMAAVEPAVVHSSAEQHTVVIQPVIHLAYRQMVRGLVVAGAALMAEEETAEKA